MLLVEEQIFSEKETYLLYHNLVSSKSNDDMENVSAVMRVYDVFEKTAILRQV